MFLTFLQGDHMEIWFYLKYGYLKEHISAFKKNWFFGLQVK